MISRLLKSFAAHTGGATVVEYALIGGVIGVALIAGLGDVSNGIKNVFDMVSNHVDPK